MVECFLAKEDVAGSTPVSRSKEPACQSPQTPHLRYTHNTIQLHLSQARRLEVNRGAVPKR